MHASIEASDRQKNESGGSGGRHHRGYQGGRHDARPPKDKYPVSDVSVWESGGGIKIFTGGQDGKWRLWNTAGGTFVKEFEHYVGGPVDCVQVAAHYFFCGFDASPKEAPDGRAGMVHVWNLNAPSEPPSELRMGAFSPYASSGKIRSLLTNSDGSIFSGGHDGAVRHWAFDAAANGNKGGFGLVRTMHGHIGGVTALAVAGGMLWTGGSDSTIRLWDVASGENRFLIAGVAREQKQAATNNGTPPQAKPGHSGSVTGLVPFDAPNGQGSFVISSSYDSTVKVWNATNGDCVASESHGQGVSSIALSSDLKGNPLILCGLQYGDIMIRGTISNPPLVLLLKISHQFIGCGHQNGPVNAICPGPGNTFYAVGDDGKLTVWQITGDFGL